jgi:catechol 2,3-dioxygenase-like lactoylglutathione lyase family enzyme
VALEQLEHLGQRGRLGVGKRCGFQRAPPPKGRRDYARTVRTCDTICTLPPLPNATGEGMPLTSLNHYLIVSKNLERSKKFYQKVLGLKLASERPDFGFPGYWLKAGNNICVHLASQAPNRIRDQFLLKKHPKGTNGSGSVDHVAFLAEQPEVVRRRIQKHNVEMHYRSFPESKLFQIFLKDPDDVTIELNFLGEVIDAKSWRGKGAASAVTLRKSHGKRTRVARQG